LDQLAADLGQVPKNIGPFINSAVQFTSVKVKKAAAKSVGRKRWSAAAAAIDYELKVHAGLGGSSITSEIGYNKGKAGGPLGNLREFGAPGQNTPPSNDLLNALEANQADFEKGLSKAAADAERKAGL
jgi:hypothetical protein